MANGSKHSRLDGWQHQANRLALKHTVVPKLPRTPTVPSPRRQVPDATPRLASPAVDADQRAIERPIKESHGQVAKPAAQPFSREETLEWIQKARKAVLATRAERASAADERIAELEASLEAALARVAFLQDENQSLQNSLDLTVDENLDLARRVAEVETRDDEVRSKLQSSEMTRAEYELAAAAAERKIELLQNLVRVKETRLQKADEARKKMQLDTGKLLATTRSRDQALADAEQRISILTELFEKLELRLETGETEATSRDIHLAINPQLPLKEPVPVQKPSRQSKLWQRALDTDDWLLGGLAARQN
jgi:DNA repair exonuclease SbcCD ATPase subunit